MKNKFPEGIPKHLAYEEVGGLFLASALNFAVEFVLDIGAGKIFDKKLQLIEPPDIGDDLIGKSFEELEEMANDIPQADEVSVAWQASLEDSRRLREPVTRSDHGSSVDAAGHFVMLAAYVELSMNAYLETMIERGEIDIELWDAIEKWEILQKAVFAFGAEIKSSTITISGLKRLQRLRNNFVHFKSGHYGTHEVSVAELLNIWSDVEKLLKATERLLPPSGFSEAITYFSSQFVSE